MTQRTTMYLRLPNLVRYVKPDLLHGLCDCHDLLTCQDRRVIGTFCHHNASVAIKLGLSEITKVCTTLPDFRSGKDSPFTRPNRFSQDRKNIVINNEKS